MLDANKLKADLLDDIRVELTEEFDKNFERKGFFSDKWKPRAHDYQRGSLLAVSDTLRRSIRAGAESIEDGVRFSSAVPYAAIHNEGGKITVTPRMKKFCWFKFKQTGDPGWKYMALMKVGQVIQIPQRQFIGDGPETARLIDNVINDFCKRFGLGIAEVIRKGQ